VTRRFQRPLRILAACVGTASGIWAIPLGGCGDLVGVGSLSGGDNASVADGSVRDGRSVGDDVGVDAVDAGVDEAADAVDSDDAPDATGCPSDSGVAWVPWSASDVPTGAFYVGFEPVTASDPDAGSYYYYVCRARDANSAGDMIPGMFVDSIGCFYTLDGVQQFKSSSYDVLVDPSGCLTWTTYDGGLARAVVGGSLGQDPLYVCSAPLTPQASWWQSGYLVDVPDAICRVPTSGGSPQDLAMSITIATQ
jgi:hypothetical protein